MSSPAIPQISEVPADLSILPCVICINPLGEERDIESQEELITRLACQHLFHKNCLSNWIENGVGAYNKCPQCREPIDEAILSQYPPRQVEQVRCGSSPRIHVLEAIFVFYITAALTTTTKKNNSNEKGSETSPYVLLNFPMIATISGYTLLCALNAISYCRRPDPEGEVYPPLTRLTVNIGKQTLRGLRVIKGLFLRALPSRENPVTITPVELIGRQTESPRSP